jgi:hypothetical protein
MESEDRKLNGCEVRSRDLSGTVHLETHPPRNLENSSSELLLLRSKEAGALIQHLLPGSGAHFWGRWMLSWLKCPESMEDGAGIAYCGFCIPYDISSK